MGKVDGLKSKSKNLFERNTILLNENERLKKENAELRNNGFTVSAMTEQQLKVAIEKGEQLEKENAELRDKLNKIERKCKFNFVDLLHDVENESKQEEQLTKAKDLLKKMYYLYHDPCVTNKDLENRDKLFEEVKQFIKEIEK